jgi:hypothetical protein
VKLITAMTDPRLMGKCFGRSSWAVWRVLAKALDGLPLTADELAIYQRVTGRQLAPVSYQRGFIGIVARRSGKTSFVAAGSVHAGFEDYSALLAPGEQAFVVAIAVDRAQAGVLFSRIRGLIADSPVYRREVARETSDEIELANGNIITVMTCSFRAIRGRTFACVVLDEAAFFRSDESANPDVELVRAVLPGLSTLNGRLLVISSPWARRGYVYMMKQKFYANDASTDVLVAKGDTATFNPTFNKAIITAAYADDAIAARTEYGGEDREDISQHFPDDDIDAAITPNVPEIPPALNYAGGPLSYFAFVDPSGGRHDLMVLAIAHVEGTRVILDRLSIARPPFDPETVVGSFAATLKTYRLRNVMGDRYGAEWVSSAFARANVAYMASERDRSALFLECLPIFAERRVALLDNARLISELRGLERKPKPGGRDSVTHGPGGTDDVANAACGAIWMASRAAHAGAGAQTVVLHRHDFWKDMHGWEPPDVGKLNREI